MCTSTAGRAHDIQRYAGCECKPCFEGDGVTTCTVAQCANQPATPVTGQRLSLIAVATTAGLATAVLAFTLLLVCWRCCARLARHRRTLAEPPTECVVQARAVDEDVELDAPGIVPVELVNADAASVNPLIVQPGGRSARKYVP